MIYDVGLVRTKERIRFGYLVQPINLPILNYELPEYADITITGWGKARVSLDSKRKCFHQFDLKLTKNYCTIFLIRSSTRIIHRDFFRYLWEKWWIFKIVKWQIEIMWQTTTTYALTEWMGKQHVVWVFKNKAYYKIILRFQN